MYYSDQNDVRTTSIQYYSVLQSTTPVLLRTTKYYLVLLQYYSVLQSTTPVLQSITLYYKVLIQYYSVLQTYYSSTTPYYKVLLQYYKVLLCTTKYYSSTTSTETTSEWRPSSTTPYYKVLLQYYSVLQTYYSSTTPYYSSTTKYYSVLQSTTPVLLRPKRRQNDVHPVLLRTTKYYSSTTKYYPVLPRTTPVLLRTTKYYSSTTSYYKVLLQYYSVLQSSTKASKTSISCEASATFQGTSFQNEHFVRGFLNFSKNKLPKRVFRARLPQLFKRQASKTSISCEASATFQGTSFQNEHFVRGFRNFSRNKLPKRAFRARLPQLFKEQASKTSISCETSATFQATSFQNEHFVRGFRNFSRNKLPKRAFRARLPQLFKEQASKTSISCEASATFQGTSFQNEHFVRGFRNFSKNKLPKRVFRARLPQLFKRQASKTSISCEASATFQGTSFQNEHFVRGFRNFSRNKLPKRAFRARLPQLFNQGASKVLRLPRKTRKWPLTLKVWSVKTSISCETSFKFHTFNSKIDDFVRVFLIKPFLQSSKSMTFPKLPPLFKTITKSCACHDICCSVTFARHCHCDSWKQHLRHVTKCCACHDIAKGHITKCCACHEKTTRLHWHTAKVLRLSRKTRKWPHILWLGSAKTSISCETSSTFHTLKDRMVSQCECTAQWQRINELATSWRRVGDDEATTRQQNKANTGPTPDPNYKRESFATHSGKRAVRCSFSLFRCAEMPRNGSGAQCQKCPANTFSDVYSSGKLCHPCPAGSESPEGSTSRSSCMCEVGVLDTLSGSLAWFQPCQLGKKTCLAMFRHVFPQKIVWFFESGEVVK